MAVGIGSLVDSYVPHNVVKCMLVISGWAECIYPPNQLALN
jgi:hypothetical protein